MDKLDVYLCNRLAGALERADDGSLSFHYLTEYLDSGNAAVLSETLPLSPEPFGERDIAAFFSNLLPDESARRRIAEILRLPPEDTFSLLKILGCDCAGAIAFYPAGVAPRDPAEPSFRELDEREAAALLRDLSNRPLGIDEEFRGISAAGSQDKLIACVKDGKILLPLNGTPSTHIIKPGIERFPESVINEWFCMKLSKACGFNTADCDILRIDGEDFYVTTRYDRETLDGITQRLHQEDFCQLLKCRPEIKYQDQGGPSLAECAKLILDLRLPAADALDFVNRVIFNFLIGNGDAHGKNFSVLYRDKTPRLAPVYDALSTTVYPAIAKKMAMKFDGKYEFRWVTAGKIVQTFARAGIGEKTVRDAITRQCDKIREILHDFIDRAQTEHPSPILHDIAQGIHRRMKQLTP